MDCRDVIALRIKSSTDLTQPPLVFNISDGVLIDGAVPITKQDYIAKSDSNSFCSTTDEWWDSLSNADISRMRTLVRSRRVRQETLNLINDLRSIFKNESIPWFPTLVHMVESRLDLSDKSPTLQVPIRIIKSTILKAILTISQRFHVLNKDHESRQARLKFGAYSKERLLELCNQLEQEAYLLFDSVDDLLSGTNN